MKKGLTLIELLATIVILSIILIISVPIISQVLSDVKEKSLVISVGKIEKEIDNIILKKESNQINGEIIIKIVDYNTIESNNEAFADYKFSNNIKDGYIKIEEDNSYQIIVTDGTKVVSKSNLTEQIISNYTEGCCTIDTGVLANVLYQETNEIYVYPTFTSSVRFDQTIGQGKTAEYFSVLTFNSPGYDERGLLKFDIPSISPEIIESVELFAYYYTGDIPSRDMVSG